MADFLSLETFFGLVAISLGLTAFSSYLYEVRNGSTRPHPISWLIWTFASTIGTIIQFENGAGWASFSSGATAFASLVILLHVKRSDWVAIRRIDSFNLIAAIAALVFWQAVDSPEASAVLLSAAAGMGFASTVRKAYDDPHSENLKTFLIQTVKLCIAMAIVVDYNFVTIYSIGTGLAFNAITSALVIGRRYQLAEKPEVVLTPAYT